MSLTADSRQVFTDDNNNAFEKKIGIFRDTSQNIDDDRDNDTDQSENESPVDSEGAAVPSDS